MRTGLLIVTLSPLLLKPLSSISSMSLHSSFQNNFILDPFHSNTLIIMALFPQIIWIIEFTRPNSWHKLAFFLPFSICHITLIFPSMLKTFLLFVNVSMLSHYQSPVKCIYGNFTHKVNYGYYRHLRSPEFM
jgi:hypothetical protein